MNIVPDFFDFLSVVKIEFRLVRICVLGFPVVAWILVVLEVDLSLIVGAMMLGANYYINLDLANLWSINDDVSLIEFSSLMSITVLIAGETSRVLDLYPKSILFVLFKSKF